MHDYWTVIERKTGRQICQCAEELDAMLLVSLDSEHKTYTKNKFIMDQVIDIKSKVDKQLPGQLGLPQGQDRLTFETDKISLPQSEVTPFNI
jgi:hypothetical protein